MRSLKVKDWYLFGEWHSIYWFHSCYLDAYRRTIKKKTGLELSQFVAEQDGSIQRIYFSRSEWTELGKKYLNKVTERPIILKNLLNEINQAADELVLFSSKIKKVKLDKMSPKDRLEFFKKYHKLHHNLWTLGQVPNLLELENSYLTDYLKDWLEIRVDKNNLETIFQILVIPRELSMSQKEEKDMLKLVNSGRREMLKSHYSKYKWLEFGWIGPSLGLKYFEKRYNHLIKNKKDRLKIQDKVTKQKKLNHLKKETVKGIKISPKLRTLFVLMEELLYMKTKRMDTLYMSYDAIWPLLELIADDYNLKIKQVYGLYPDWLLNMINTELVKDKINNIIKYSVQYYDGDKIHLLVKSQAHELMKRVRKDVFIPGDVGIINGQCAFRGKVLGVVKIVNRASDITKFKKGDILVSNVTDPSLLPAMKKANAFVTNMGGLTCHAAIVARELGTPCVVGTKIATKVLKDGDRVEINATKGIIKKLK